MNTKENVSYFPSSMNYTMFYDSIILAFVQKILTKDTCVLWCWWAECLVTRFISFTIQRHQSEEYFHIYFTFHKFPAFQHQYYYHY